MKVLLVSSAVGPIGSGMTGGVSDALRNMAAALVMLGHAVDILSSEHSSYDGDGRLIGIAGDFQPTILADTGASGAWYPVIPSSLLGNYWHYAQSHQDAYDAIINLCHDWLPYYLTPFMRVPLLHRANVGDANPVVSEQIRYVAGRFPARVAVLSKAQAQALGIEGSSYLLTHSVQLSRYDFSPEAPASTLIWCARISREKGLEHAAKIARLSGSKLAVCGYMQDAQYFSEVQSRYGDVIVYRGFLDKPELVREMGRAAALLCTQQFMEAFGLVAIEALACGTPVITYDRGGPAEIVRDGVNGFVVKADDIAAAARAVSRLSSIRRQDCRSYCEEHYSMAAYAKRVEDWLQSAIK